MESFFNTRGLPALFLILLVLSWITVPATFAATDNRSRIQLDNDNWNCTGADEDDGKTEASLREALLAWQNAWVGRDVAACKAILADDVLLVSQSQGGIFSGRDAALAALPREWEEFETDDHGSSALNGTLLKVKARVQGNTALLRYYMEISGGNLWEFEDTGAFAQIFVRNSANSPWQLAFGTNVWGLCYDPDSGEADEPTFAYDYGMPVKDLGRAVKFYQPLLGEPEALTKTMAVFEVKGSRLYLVAGEMAKLAPIRAGLPNGWVIITPPDFDSSRDEGKAKGVTFEGEEREFADFKILYGYEPSGNLIALARPPQRISQGTQSKLVRQSTVKGSPLAPAVAAADTALRTAWLDGDVEAYLKQCMPDAAILDAARSLTRGWSKGTEKLQKILRRDFAVRSCATLELKDGISRQFGPWQVVTRRRITKGAEPWKRRGESVESCIYSLDSGRLALSLTLLAGRPLGMALQFDYSGMPVTKEAWKKTDHAFRALTGGAGTYKDEGWKGFWGERAVMGMFVSDPKDDRMPREHEASTYLSMDVIKAEKALHYAKQAGSQLPSISAINGEKPGLNRLRGYNQVYFTDSEGNGIVLTEYTGRGKARGAKNDD